MITHHTDLINAIIQKYNLKSYLEIGVNDPAMNFAKIKCETKIGVDPYLCLKGHETSNSFTDKVFRNSTFFPMSSDYYFDELFSHIIPVRETLLRIDLIFIDGLHHADQAKRDFDNSLKCLNDNGFILIHDCLPEKEETTIVPRETKIWHGDVYKLCMTLPTYTGIDYKTFNIDNGCCLVWKAARNYGALPLNVEPTWENYKKFGRLLMNVQDEVTI